jgi:aspartyl-tRNA(Asn)/glutamyl-tRNA(Gln) amidotransferase subunit A
MASIRELHQQLINKERSAVEITKAALDRIQVLEPKLHSFLCLTGEGAIEQARRVDAKIAAGEDIGILEGIPLALKDNMCTKGITTTCGSQMLENFVSPYDATVVEKLNAAGAIVVGKTNLDEFAMGGSTENSAFQTTVNPWDLNRVSGGSSGGSAAAVAAEECTIAVGSDTGGSIRQPASFCGVVGMKPTYGLVSRYGLVAFASSLDQIGPIGRTVEDTALLMEAIAGYDPKDATSLKAHIPNYSKCLRPDLKPRGRLRVGIIQETFGEGLGQGIESAVTKAVEVLQDLGVEVQVVSCPRFRYGLSAYYIIAPSEASANLARYDGVKYGLRAEEGENLVSMYGKTRAEGFGPEVKRRIMLGTYALSAGYYDAYYLKAQKVRTLLRRDFDRAFAQADVLITPTVPTTAFKTGEKTDDPLSMYLADLMTVPISLAGLPAINVPCGFDDEGMPIGMQMIGNVLQEEMLFEVAHAYEQATDWHKRKPMLG